MVTFVTVDPLALRPRLSPGLPLSNDKVDNFWKKIKSLVLGTRLAHINNKIVCHLWRPGNHSPVLDFRPVGFASPAFARFAIIGYFLLTTVYDVYSGLCFTDLLTTN
jgi:hypothetical protein